MTEHNGGVACHCAGNLRLCFITGLGYGSRTIPSSSSSTSSLSEEVKKSLEKIKTWVGVNQVKTIIHKGKTPGEPDPKTVKEIHEVMKREGALCQCGKITNVFIGHSHGAKCLRAALLTVPGYAAEIGKYTDQMAVFTIGGLQILPKCSAKVTGNYYFENDIFISKWKSSWWDKKEEDCNIIVLGPLERHSKKFDHVTCSCCVMPRLPASDESDETTNSSILTEGNPATNAETSQERVDRGRLVDGGFQTAKTATGAAKASYKNVRRAVGVGALMPGDDNNSWINAHYIHEYVNCKTLEREIKQKLSGMYMSSAERSTRVWKYRDSNFKILWTRESEI